MYMCYMNSFSISSKIMSRYFVVLQVHLGVLLKNENRTEDMIEILEHAQQYVPTLEGRLQKIFFGGDQLTCERIRGAKNARHQSPTPKGQLEGLSEKVEDWHALQAYYQVIWQELYSTKSARDKCSLYQLRNLIDRKDVTTEPKGTMHACQSFLTVVLEAEILAALAGVLGLSTLDIDAQTLFGDDSLPESSAGRLQAITKLAEKVLSCTSLDRSVDSTSLQKPLFPGDDTGNYCSKLLSMGVLSMELRGCHSRRRWRSHHQNVEVSAAFFQTGWEGKIWH